MTLDDAYWQRPLPQPLFDDFDIEREVMVPMRDGVRLSTDVYLPRGGEGPLPTVLVKTPYDKDDGEGSVRTKWVDYFARQGYAIVVQNERGFLFSEGVFVDYLVGAGTDGPDTVAWILEQPWSNGRVGTIGCSSSGEHQWPMASANAPGHVAMVPGASGTAVGDVPGNDTRGAFYKVWLVRRLPVREGRWRCWSREEASSGVVPFQEADRLRPANRRMSPTSASSGAASEGPMPCRSMSVEPRAMRCWASFLSAALIFLSMYSSRILIPRRS